jgi:hypothetical protein
MDRQVEGLKHILEPKSFRPFCCPRARARVRAVPEKPLLNFAAEGESGTDTHTGAGTKNISGACHRFSNIRKIH